MSTLHLSRGGTALVCLWLAASAPAWQSPLLTVGPGAARVDGVLAPGEWDGAAETPAFCDFQSGRLAEVQTRVAAVWDEDALYLGFWCDEPRMADIKAGFTERDAGLWGEDCVEVFLDPPGDGPYYHFGINALGTLADEKAQDLSWNCEATASAERVANAWTCELAIPWAALGGPPGPRDVWTANFTRNRKVAGEQLTCWSVTGGSFHNPGVFGTLVFAEQAAGVAQVEVGELLPGTSRLRARMIGGGAAVRLSATRPRRVLAEGSGPEWAFELAPDDLRAPLELALLDREGRIVALQAFATRAPLAPASGGIAEALEKLEALAASGELAQLLDAGTAAVAQLEAALNQARAEGRTLTPDEWAQLALRLRDFEAECLKPVVWTCAAGAAKPPDGPTGEVSVDIALAVNERESCALLVKAPLLTTPVQLLARMGDLAPLAPVVGLDARTLRNRITLLETVAVPLRQGGTVTDPLAPLPASGLFLLPPGETRELWVRFDSEGATPGCYFGTLTLAPLDPRAGVQAVTVPLRVRVWDLSTSNPAPVAVYVSDYGRSAVSPAHREDLLAHHVTVLNANGLPSPDAEGHVDLSRLGPYLEPVRGKGVLFLEIWFMRETGWQPRYANWVREVCDEMERLGYRYEDWILQIYDETLSDEFLECCRQVKAIEPRIRLFTDYIGTPEVVRAFAPYVDIWCPYWADLNRENGACLQAMRDTGKPIWTYDCGGTKSTPVGRYRALSWTAWRHGLDGVYGWCYPGSLWDETPLTDFNYGHVYEGYRGEPVPSRRWEAFGDGVEDLLLLRAYEAKTRAAPTAEDDALLAEARGLADQGPGADASAMTDLRGRIARRLLTLNGTPLARDFPRLSLAHWQTRISGDGQGTAVLEPGTHDDVHDLALVLRSETEKSWTFAVQPLQAAEGERVRLSVWVKGRGSLRVGICGGFRFGDDPGGHIITGHTVDLTDEWQPVTVEQVVTQTPVEAFIGFDYGNAGATGTLSSAEIEVREP